MVASRTFSFRAEADFGERHDRALAELDRLRRERPRLADSVRYDFDVRLADSQRRGLASPGERLRATVHAFVAAVESALADEHVLDRGHEPPDDDALAAARARADPSPPRLAVRRTSGAILMLLRNRIAMTRPTYRGIAFVQNS